METHWPGESSWDNVRFTSQKGRQQNRKAPADALIGHSLSHQKHHLCECDLQVSKSSVRGYTARFCSGFDDSPVRGTTFCVSNSDTMCSTPWKEATHQTLPLCFGRSPHLVLIVVLTSFFGAQGWKGGGRSCFSSPGAWLSQPSEKRRSGRLEAQRSAWK